MSSLSHVARQVNVVSVETPAGLRSFELFEGDVCSHPADLLVISAHPDRDQPSQLVTQLQDSYGFVVDADSTFLSLGPDVSAGTQAGAPGTPFRHLLSMRIAPPRAQQDPAAFYDRAIRGTFAAVAALEFLGLEFRTIALPVLVRQGIADYATAVRSLLRHALAWLRQSHATQTVRYFVFDPGELSEWDAALNSCLGRTYVEAQGEAVLRSLCLEIVGQIDSGLLQRHFAELESPLRKAVADPDRLCVQTVAAFGRKLAELATEQLCRDLQRPLGRDLMSNIESVRESGLLAAWICSYLHSLRVFGNEGVHSLAARKGAVPARLSPDDLTSMLCAIRAVLRFWSEWRQGPHATTTV